MIITWKSINNRRIERLLLDVKKGVVIDYRSICYYMLHYVFLPGINRSLNELLNVWNDHPLCTAGNRLHYSSGTLE